jgi:hypothetical protein
MGRAEWKEAVIGVYPPGPPASFGGPVVFIIYEKENPWNNDHWRKGSVSGAFVE